MARNRATQMNKISLKLNVKLIFEQLLFISVNILSSERYNFHIDFQFWVQK